MWSSAGTLSLTYIFCVVLQRRKSCKYMDKEVLNLGPNNGEYNCISSLNTIYIYIYIYIERERERERERGFL